MEMLVFANMVLTVLGLGGLVFWLRRQIGAMRGSIKALKDTVQAQDQTINAIGGLNRIALEMVKAVGPERWAKEVKEYKNIVDERANAAVEQAQRRFEAEAAGRQTRTAEVIKYLAGLSSAYLRLVVLALAYVPRGDRRVLIDRTSLPEDIKASLRQLGDELPEFPLGEGFGRISAGAATALAELLGSGGGKEGHGASSS